MRLLSRFGLVACVAVYVSSLAAGCVGSDGKGPRAAETEAAADVAAAGDTDGGAADAVVDAGPICTPDESAPTWNGGIEALIGSKCVVCHGDPVSSGAPMPLVTYDDTRATSLFFADETVFQRIVERVGNGSMPPGSTLLPLEGDEQDQIVAWAEACAPLGEAVCEPQCDDKACGDDGCEGSCGECEDTEACTDDGQCECVVQCEDKACGDDGCGGSCGECEDTEECNADGQCACVPQCDDKVCGDDTCGGTCGECDGEGVCIEGQCCTPDCYLKDCGDDGCGDTCGECEYPTPFCADNQCVADCEADCTGKACGDNGCGASCGECDAGQACSAEGQCECEAQCGGKECGDDTCGGDCGTCEGNDECNDDGQCECVSQCGGKECGDDGCGDPCGTCGANEECQDNQCEVTLVEITVSDFEFDPSSVTIKSGVTVRWVLEAGFHTVASGTEASPDGTFGTGGNPLDSGTAFEHTFDAAGSFPYFCEFHTLESMTAEITVE